MKVKSIMAQIGSSGSFQPGNTSERKEKTVDDFLMFELAEMIGRERRQEAEKYRLLRQIQAERPRVLNAFGLYFGKLVMALAIALRLR